MNHKLLNLATDSRMLSRALPTIGKMSLQLSKRSPELALAAGVISGVAAAVTFAHAWKQHEEVLSPKIESIKYTRVGIQDHNDDVDAHNDANPDAPRTDYIEKDAEVKAMSVVYGQMVGTAVRLYGPPTLFAAMSLYLVLSSHGIMKGRNKGLVAALGVMERGYAQYRKRVIAEHGEEADERYFYGYEQQTVTETHKDPETGKKKKTKSTRNVAPEELTPEQMYVRVWDHTNPQWRSDKSLNRHTLKAVETILNQQLLAKGWVSLNEVFTALSIPRTSYGQIVGWSVSTFDTGDRFISFGIERNDGPENGNRFVLSFNCHGPIYRSIDDLG